MSDASVQDLRFSPPGPAPGPRDISPIDVVLKFASRPLEAWPRAVFETPVWRPPLPGTPIFLMDPTAIGEVFVSQAPAFPQGALWRRMMRPVWGDGMVTSDGAAWRWQRHAAAPAFRPAQMQAMAPIMARAASDALARWPDGGRIDVAEEAARITFDILLDVVLSGGEDFDRGGARELISGFMGELGKMRLSYYLGPDAYHEGRVTPAAPEAAELRAVIDAMIRRRRTAPPRGDLVDLLLAARDPETGQAMDDAILRDNLLGFIVAGHETSAVALTWAIYVATAHAPTLTRLRAEVADVAGDQPIEAGHVPRLTFTRQVVQEALRLYPPAHTSTRVCIPTTQVGGVTIKAGTRVLIPIYALHRHRLWWRDPDVFDPDRFAADQPTPDRHLYMPFGAGPRVCLGAAFAMTELVVMLAILLRGADFALAPGHRVWPLADMALRPQGGMPMDVRLRPVSPSASA